MMITMQATKSFAMLNGLPTRIWTGITGKGVRVFCFVAGVAVEESLPADQYAEFARDLEEMTEPHVQFAASVEVAGKRLRH